MESIRYRTVYNQDCTHLFAIVEKRGDEISPDHVDRMVDEIAEGGADLLLINSSGQPGRTNYPSRVWQPFWEQRGDLPGVYRQMENLADRGVDYLSRSLERCRQCGIGAGVSIRMNDTHNTPWPDDPVHSDFFTHHPEWRIHAPYRTEGPYSMVSAMDYSVLQVRDYFLSLIEEITEEYSPEVLELDFMRFPLYFRPDEAAEQASTLTGFVRQVRALVKSTLLFVRVPVTPGAAADYGMNVSAWTQEHLVDGISVAAHFITAWDMDPGAWRRLVGEEVALYSCAESAAYCPEGFPGPSNQDGSTERVMGLDEQLLRGFAAAQLAAGADGIYLFNYFCAREWKLREPLFGAISQLRDPGKLAGKAKTYCLAAAAGNWHLGESDGALQVSRTVEARTAQTFYVSIGPEPPDLPVEIEVLVDENDPIDSDRRFHLHINGASLGRPDTIRPVEELAPESHIRAVVFAATTDQLLAGRNAITLWHDEIPIRVVSLLVHVGE